jgi:hypothetical protein
VLAALAIPTLVHAMLASAAEPPRAWTLAPPLELATGVGVEDLRVPASLALAPAVLQLGDVDSSVAGAGAAPEPDEHAAKLRWWGQTLRVSTAASLVVTTALGTIAAINQPTAFGDGNCITGNPVFGLYGCDRGLSTLHGVSGVVSLTLYTANGALALAAPESRGTVSPGAKPYYRVLTWVHLGGILVQPILGIIAAQPQLIGKSTTVPTDPLPRDLRTAHIFIGYITTLAFLTTTALEW